MTSDADLGRSPRSKASRRPSRARKGESPSTSSDALRCTSNADRLVLRLKTSDGRSPVWKARAANTSYSVTPRPNTSDEGLA